MVYMSFLSLGVKVTIHTAWKAQIASLLIKKVTILAKYANFSDVFLKKSAKILPKNIEINKNAIKLKDDKQPPYRLIYSPGPVELKTLKIYIKINLTNSFIGPLKSLTGGPILFICKPNSSF